MKISQAGIALIKRFESLHDGDLTIIGLQPKMCPAGIWTEGYGHAMMHNGKFLKGKENKELAYSLHAVNNETEASALLVKDLVFYEKSINSLGLDLTQNMFDALVSFIFNVGFKSLQGSTLFKRINSSVGDIKEAFLMWNKCKGEELRGLTLRREAEANLYLQSQLI
jgi:lysozyme